MSLDIGKVSDLYKAATLEKENCEKTDKSGLISMADYFWEETKIQSAENTGDMYDRGQQGNDAGSEKLLLNEEVLQKLGEVVNADNFSMYEELGLAPDKDDPTSILTVSERIEIELATHCENYKPTGTISTKDIESLYGESGLAYHVANELTKQGIEPDEEQVSKVMETVDKVQDIRATGINQEASAYLLVNHKSLTVDNVYKAIHSVSAETALQNKTASQAKGVSQAKTASQAGNLSYQTLSEGEWTELKGQVEGVLEKSGLNVNESTMEDARWLIENKIPLTGENIYKLGQIREINENQFNDESIDNMGWATKITADMVFVSEPGATSMNYYKSVEGDSIEAVTILQNGTDEQVEALLSDGKEVNLLNLKRYQENETRHAQEERAHYISAKAEDKAESDTARQREIITAKRQLEEARLMLTVQSGAMLIKQGIEIDIMPLSEMVEKLREMENELTKAVFNGIGYEAKAEEIALYQNTTDYIRNLKNTPAYVLGSVYQSEIEFTVTDMVAEGAVKENVLKSAQAAYETLGTKPDKELGDSLRKAFASIPQMLEEMELEDSEANRRAVRILSYNEIEISAESIGTIKELDAQVSRLMENLTPRTTAYLIANGINPLRTDIAELNDSLDELHEEIGMDEVETYSEYLWKLEKNGKISKKDREAYIGIYRVLHMIENTDRRAIGAVLKRGGDLTMQDLLTAVRSVKNSGMDISVDDELGLTQEVIEAENSVDKQLKNLGDSVFYKRAKEVVSPELLDHVMKKSDSEDENDNSVLDMKSEEFMQYICDKSLETFSESGWNTKELRGREMENLRYVSEESIQNLLEDGVKMNGEHLMGIQYMMQYRGKLFGKIQETLEEENETADASDRKVVKQDIASLEDELELAKTDAGKSDEEVSDEIKEKLAQFTKDIREALLEKTEIKAEDVRQINKMVQYMEHASDTESYYVPMRFGNEQMLVKLTRRKSEGEAETVKVTMYGENEVVEAEFAKKENGIRMTQATGLEDGRRQEIEEQIYQALEEAESDSLYFTAKQFLFRINNSGE
ncbi:MAG: hypothetical protein IJA27_08370 [Lachnospiraceae bacterium]|nr:hypothetical protein [Lachnospiraceae bacterium]